jgi:hypothetical protein
LENGYDWVANPSIHDGQRVEKVVFTVLDAADRDSYVVHGTRCSTLAVFSKYTSYFNHPSSKIPFIQTSYPLSHGNHVAHSRETMPSYDIGGWNTRLFSGANLGTIIYGTPSFVQTTSHIVGSVHGSVIIPSSNCSKKTRT